ncbi:hypothetical protein CDO52_19490 [Nocardiopsis gilva YIM 90087]|uniref:Uncharacterized protein n=1 Tax=Nocardiopsis gilva YIM 90087 TaxID=1235441 RepID=A0A223S9B4_9ACTN|nr:hypothetical protein [Nocardiopsis gilva]ASU84693.1 hypothetical protein CDO52_19490 [Nocardiopsis gilva YIM 90087]
MAEQTYPSPPPSLSIRRAGVTIRLTPQALVWEDAVTVSHIPYTAITDAEADPFPAYASSLRVTVRDTGTGHPSVYELLCSPRDAAAFAAAITAQIPRNGDRPPPSDQPAITVAPRPDEPPLLARHEPQELATRVLLMLFTLNSLGLIIFGEWFWALMSWCGFIGWYAAGALLTLAVNGIRSAWLVITKGVRVETRYSHTEQRRDSEGNSTTYQIYTFTDPSGLTREYTHIPGDSDRSTPKQSRNIRFVPSELYHHDISSTFEVVLAFVTTPLLIAAALFAGAIGFVNMPGRLFLLLVG